MRIPEYLLRVLPAVERDKDLGERVLTLNLIVNAFFQSLSMFMLAIHLLSRGKYLAMGSLMFGATLTALALTLIYRRGFSVLAVHFELGSAAIVFCLNFLFPLKETMGALVWFIPSIVTGTFLLPVRQSLVWFTGFILIGLSLLAWGDRSAGIGPEAIQAFAVHFTGASIVVFLEVLVMQSLQRHYAKSLKEAQQKLCHNLEESRMLLRILTHDVADPLLVVRYNISRIDTDDRNRAVRIIKINRAVDTVSIVLSSVHRLQALIDGKTRLELKDTSLSELVQESIENFEDRLKDKKLKTSIEVGSEYVLVDPHLFKIEVLANLLSNAIKFSPEGGTIELKSKVDFGGVSLSIRDQGDGISAERLPSLFSIMHRSSTDGTHGEKGTGFGLTIVKRITEMMYGKIEIRSVTRAESASSHGTEVIIRLKQSADPQRELVRGA